MAEKPKISDAEWAVMNVLWEKSPVTANEIVAKLEQSRSWNPKTIRTLINRLVNKGVVAYEKAGRQHLYRPAVSRDECLRKETQSFFRRAGAAAIKPMLAAFIEEEELSSEEIQELKDILEKKGGE